MIKHLPAFIILLFFGLACQTEKSAITEKKTVTENEYPRWVGDIQPEQELDDPEFQTCTPDDNIYQYFNTGEGPQYPGGKPRIEALFQSQYQPVSDPRQDGLIRIRFVVNCKGEAGRFRVLQSNYYYQPFEFKEEIVSQLLNITQSIEKWELVHKDGEAVDYYYYLIFQIQDGKLLDIMP